MERFEDVGLIDDEAFAEAWVASRQQRKHLSRRALAAELTRKGVERETARAALDSVSSDDELSAAIDLARSRAPRLAGLDPVVQRRRLQGVLARRGFNSSIVIEACRVALDSDQDDASGEWGL